MVVASNIKKNFFYAKQEKDWRLEIKIFEYNHGSRYNWKQSKK